MCDTCGCKGAETFEAEDAFRGMRKGSTKIIEGFDVKKLDKYTYRITDETLKDGSFVVLMFEALIIPYEKRHDMEGWNWKEGWQFSEASFNYGMLRNTMKPYNRSMSYGFNTQMEALKFLKKAYDNGDFEDGYLIFDAEGFEADGFDAEMIIDTDKYEGYDNWEGTKVNMANRANVLLITDAPKILNAYKKLLAENRRLYERMNLAEEYIRNPQSWVSYSFEVLNKNLGENEEYMMDGLTTGHKFSYRDEMGAETFDVEGFGRWKNRMKKEATQMKFIEMTKAAIIRLQVLESVLNEHNLERALNESSIVELEDALKEINEITMWLIKNNGSFYTAGKKFGFFDAETFEAEMDIDSIDPNDVYMIDKDEIVDWFVNRERKIMKDSSKEDVLGIWADYSDPDDDEYDEVESMNKDDIIQIYLFNYRDGLEGNDEEELQNRLADELEFGAEYEDDDYVEYLNEVMSYLNYGDDEYIIGGKDRSDEYFGRYGEALRKYDPIAFEVGKREYRENFEAENLSFKERIEKMIDVASPKFEGIKGLGKRIGAKQGKKLDYKIQGVLPRAKGVSSYRRNIETPKWYKGIQLGLMTGLAGFITYKLATDGSKEE